MSNLSKGIEMALLEDSFGIMGLVEDFADRQLCMVRPLSQMIVHGVPV